MNPNLVGKWATEDEDSDAVFVFSIKDGRCEVTGYCRSDGEVFEIGDVTWDDSTLSFNALMPSTGCYSKNSFTILPDGRAELELTIYETWKKLEK